MLDPEYKKRMEDWFKDQSSRSNVFDEGEEIEVLDSESILNGTDLAGNEFPDFIKEAAKYFGEEVEIHNYKGVLIGISYTYVDYYYIIGFSDNSKRYETCVSPITFLENSKNNLEM